MTLTLTKTKNLVLVAITILALLFTNLTTSPSQAADASTFTITDRANGNALLTTITGTQGVLLTKTFEITFSETGWDFHSQVSGNGYEFYNPIVQEGLTASVSFVDPTHATMTVTGTPVKGINFNSYLEVYDGTGANAHRFPFQVAIAATTATPHLSIDLANFTYGDVTGLNTAGLFTTMPSLYLDTANSGTPVELTPTDNLASTTTVNNGVTTITYSTGTLYNEDIYADVAITITDGTVSYQVQTRSRAWEGDPVAAGDIIFQGHLNAGAGTTSATSGSSLATFADGHPFALFSTADGETPTVTDGTVTMIAPSNIASRSFEFSFFDYIGCPTLNELVTAHQAVTLNVTGYESATICPAAAIVAPPVESPVVNPPVVNPPVVIPLVVVAPVTNGTHTPTSRNSSTLGWAANKAAKTIEVRVNDKVIATLEGTAITHVTSALIGPKDKVEAIAKDAEGNSSVLALFTYVAKEDIALGGVRFGADSAKLTPATKALLKKYAAAIVEHGFTTAKVAAFTKFDASRTSAFRTKLAKARAAAITTYLNEQFKAAGVAVKIIAAGKGVKARSGEVFTQ
jgi:outer membrane protein OmpA-like peptidoglycan-associated protein